MPQERRASQAQAETPKEPFLPPVVQSAIQGVLIFFLIQFVAKQFNLGGQNASQISSGGAVPTFDTRPQSLEEGASFSAIPQTIVPMWPLNTSMDISIVVSPSFIIPPLNSLSSDSKVLDERKFMFGNFNENRVIDTSFLVPEAVQKYNATLWAHIFIGITGYPMHPAETNYDPSKAYHTLNPITQYITKKIPKKTKKLLGSEESHEVGEDPTPQGPVTQSYYHPNFTMSFIPDSGSLNFPTMHPALRQYLRLESTGARDSSGQNGWYYPIFFVNKFWQLRDHMMPINQTVTRLPLQIKLNNLSNWKFSILASIDEGMKVNQQKAATGGPITASGDGSEFEEFKRILLDTNVYLLATTGIVSLLHTLFEMLAFKSDISHWRNKKDNVGVSVRAILANVIMQTVIFLYLIDNSDGTSWMILFGQGFGILIEAWKITKTVDVRFRPALAGSVLPYHITFEDKHKLSVTEKKTQEYDEIAFKYLYIVALPLLGGYGVYSLVYETHKSWYSFIITTLVGSVYAFGFLNMVPSLFINYRLKSVAHMPAKTMTYKFLNTFIDDLFAWTIKMPTLHRLATLRDDVIFFIYLYQSYKYKVDYKRVNEFGQGGDEDEEVTTLKEHTDEVGASTDGFTSNIASGRDGEKQAAKKRK
ncbi:MAG: hypothetical protein M1829_005997 [Trizodia sp. TS-e1964]|nr:MAG: hypothetical protein M1829_005997 [Trizodia sp. TS-e1964]